MPAKGTKYILIDDIRVMADTGCRYCPSCLSCKYETDCRLYPQGVQEEMEFENVKMA